MSKLLSSSDIHYTQHEVNQNITIDSSSNGLSIVTYRNSNDDEATSTSYYNSINHLFYKTQWIPGNCITSGTGSLYSHTQENINPQHKNKFNNSGILYSISGSVYGEKIRPGSF